jgi:two-component system, sensor histidine kinase and response regulator
LNVILGFSDLLMADATIMDGEHIAEMSRHVNSSAMRLYRLIENFLIYTHTEIMLTDKRQVDFVKRNFVIFPKSTIEHSARQRADHYGRCEDLELEIEDVEAVGIGEDYVRKIVEELVDNACKFSVAGTPVVVVGAPAGEIYIFSVTNQGRGMSAEQIKQVGAYMQFERRLYEQQGAGLGLIICQRLTELHGGQFDIESVPDSETTVRVQLPLKRIEINAH